jgi:hypothetical protein
MRTARMYHELTAGGAAGEGRDDVQDRGMIAAMGISLGLGLGLGPSQASDYVGADACGACHAEALQIWRRSAHASAGDPLTAGERERRACQMCHATGDAPAAPAVRPGVECEACHGAGAAYALDDVMRDPALARALGLVDLGAPGRRAALCLTCHEIGRAPFDLDAAWRIIAH